MRATLGRIADWVGGVVVGANSDTVVDRVATDSRKQMGVGTLFVALAGPTFDGHTFVDSALAKGVSASLVRADSGVQGPRVEVEGDTVSALQAMARAWRLEFGGDVVGITGSHGKTIVKEMLASILSRKRRVYRSPGSYNSQVGVALSLLELGDHDIAIIEAGISHVGEMDRLREMIAPTSGAITSIGMAHFDGLGRDLKTTAREKALLFSNTVGPVMVPPEVDASAISAPITFHVEHHSASYRAQNVRGDDDGFTFELVTPKATHGLRLATPGRYNVGNAVAAAALAIELGTDIADIHAALATFEAAPMRLEMHTTRSGITILNDAYVSDPTSARAAVEELEWYGANHRKVAILGDMRELGELAESAHEELGRFVAESGVDRLVAVGAWAKAMVEGAVAAGMDAASCEARDTLEDLALSLEQWLEPGDFVLFKGSRAVGLERVATGLVESVAPERLEVDLDAIRSNVQSLRRAAGDAAVMAVVKSFAYGNDATRVSQTLVREGVEWLAVAYPDEAIPLRGKGIDSPILVTNVLSAEADKFAKYDLTALVSSADVVRALGRAASGRGASVPVHLEIDTGMARMGVVASEAVGLADLVRETHGVRLEGVMTHFAAADDAAEDAFTLGQIDAFEATIESLRKAGHAPLLAHAANTAAAWRFPAARFDMIRVGLGLYGIAPSSNVAEAAELTPALRFTSRVLQVRNVPTGQSVGYGRSWRADRPSVVATVAIGYNDGFPRFMSNGGEVLIRGERCRVVGNVCMDATMVDVTDLPRVEAGDEVVLFGAQGTETISVDAIAERGNTISYEILTGISPRVRRIFTRSER